MLAFLSELVASRPGSVAEILTHRDRDVAEAAVARHGLREVVRLDSVFHYELPARLQGRDLGFLFWDQGDAVACMSPTKIPEYLEFGIPVVCTRASGDGATVLTRARAGVILEDPRDPAERKRALQGLDQLLLDPGRSSRAQNVAREHYSLEDAVGSQLAALLLLAERQRG